jgi:PKD repeat protein
VLFRSTCSFDGRGSSDPDGSIASWAWTFGDSSTGSGSTTSRTYATAGTYSVLLTVTDNSGATGTLTQSVTVSDTPPPSLGFSLSGTASKEKGAWATALTWSGSAAAQVDIHRNGALHQSGVSNTGSWSEVTTFKGGGSLTYKVCEAGTTTFSNETTLTY